MSLYKTDESNSIQSEYIWLDDWPASRDSPVDLWPKPRRELSSAPTTERQLATSWHGSRTAATGCRVAPAAAATAAAWWCRRQTAYYTRRRWRRQITRDLPTDRPAGRQARLAAPISTTDRPHAAVARSPRRDWIDSETDGRTRPQPHDRRWPGRAVEWSMLHGRRSVGSTSSVGPLTAGAVDRMAAACVSRR